MSTRKTLATLTVVLILVVTGSIPGSPASAQGGDASTAYDLNLRTGPGTNFQKITMLPGGTGLVLEGRNEDASWVLAHTLDGAYRGWLASLYLAFQPGVSAFRFPVTDEIVPGPVPASDQPAAESDQPAPAPGASGVGAYTNYVMNVRSGPGKNHSALGQLPAGTGVILEARNGDSSWVLIHTPDNAVRGWLASLYLRFEGVSAASLPLSDELIAPPAGGAAAGAPAISYAGIPMGSFDPARVAGIDLASVPIVGRATGRARQIFYEGRARGNNPHVVAKVGDCSSEHWYFLNPFAWGEYALGGYANLQGAINHFGASLAYDSQATHNGFNANAVLSPTWANPYACGAGESPLQCEFRLHKPSVAVIMFGTSDLLVMTPSEFDFYMRQIVDQSIQAGVIPILSTFPGNQGFWDRTIFYNQIVVRIAWDYDIPLINLWLALESLPNHGLEPDGFHLGEPSYGTSCYLTAPYLTAGYNMRNLVTMQTLDAVWRGAMQ